MNNNLLNHSEEVLSCTDLSKTFTDGNLSVKVLNSINFAVGKGERIAIVGPSGSGKSTFLHLLGGLDKASQGEVRIGGTLINHLSEKQRSVLRNRYLGFVYQFHHLLTEFTVLENVCIPLLICGTPPQEAEKKALILLENVGLLARKTHKIGELSGGERQRTAIVRALITQPVCLLADEPTGNLDTRTAEYVYQTLLQLNIISQTSLIIVTHDTNLAERMDKIFHMENGKLARVK